MTIYHLCDVCRIRMSEYIVDILDKKGSTMNDNANNEAGQQGADQVVKEDVTTESSPQEQPQVGEDPAPWREGFSEVTQEEVTEVTDDK